MRASLNRWLYCRVALILLTIMPFLAACGDASTAIYWKPPYVPIRLGLDSSGRISVSVNSREFVTSIGVFSLGAVAQTDDGPPEIEQKHLRLRFRDRSRQTDDIMDVSVGDVPYEVYLEGRTRLSFTNSEVVIDISDATCVQIIKAGNNEDLGCEDILYDQTGNNNADIDHKGISKGTVVRVTSIELNVRKAPGMDGPIITQVKNGTRLEVIDGPATVPTTSDDGRPMFREWWKVRVLGKRTVGWSSSRYLEPDR